MHLNERTGRMDVRQGRCWDGKKECSMHSVTIISTSSDTINNDYKKWRDLKNGSIDLAT